ncbi:bifunctional diaminohydroxyphosphoribosylaminopyrimidine deaminase/5-amino-6-(5-phosphoribosylamino)uracil reductase RibD [Geothrix sp. 21YS21S-4]|uniref:bifunctional diaminohydroxyphosphoribosylaminopyrimidine deaminase/5-amino-6-(5-phosphoribosylamino)uracil reductase RibD n=1 Tax=Geothrix sp. 21YS21S-4 TaxID=3068889 RepID=UPI0027B89C01|nr:bifunctional diaminohydroxyphosphoribosylaminopyrimidine deaminase/5-amino-6-(5-phosphoribosylamino)uracil reductase RibD [Geothrix sp. 21YS21S-4]
MSELSPETAWALATGGPWPVPEGLSGDPHFMALALQEGLKGVGLSSPNPPVGCALVKDGRVLGIGSHTRAGDPHGEIMALRDAESREEDVRGATAYVTLEPCCHQGRTGPCTQALLQAGIARVVVGVRDPNPRVDGGGMAILRAQGLPVEEGVLAEACARFHAPFFKFIHAGLPWVSLKLALGSDGALGPEGQRTQVTPPAVQRLGHALRRASEAIVVGRRTAEMDDPQLTDRWPAPTAPHRTFHRVVVDPAGQVPSTARIWQPVAGQPALRAVTGTPAPLRDVEDLHLPPAPKGCSLRHLLHELGARGVGRVLVEGGGSLVRDFLDQGLADEFHCFRSDAPAGGTPLDLPLPSSWERRAVARWPGGRWEVWR